MTAPRRWFQFSLLTMFVGVTLICCWLANQMSWIRQRHAFVADMETFEDLIEQTRVSYPEPAAITADIWRFPDGGRITASVPLSLRVFGETPTVDGFFFIKDNPPSEERLRRIKELFPEARIEAIDRPVMENYHGIPYSGRSRTR